MKNNRPYQLGEVCHTEEGLHSVRVTLLPEHDIFKGHFPGQPVLPGVIFLRMVADVLNQPQLKLKKVNSMKFINMADPTQLKYLDLEIISREDEQGIIIQAHTKIDGEVVHCKFSGLYTTQL